MEKTLVLMGLLALLAGCAGPQMAAPSSSGAYMACITSGGYPSFVTVSVNNGVETITCRQTVADINTCLRMTASNNQAVNPADPIPTCNINSGRY